MSRLLPVAFALLLLVSSGPALAGTAVETFADHAGMDPEQTSAHWNIFDQRLEVAPTESQASGMPEQLVSYPPDGLAVLDRVSSMGQVNLTVHRRDGAGNALWPEPVTVRQFTGTMTLRDTDLAVVGTHLLVVWSEHYIDAGLYAQKLDADGQTIWPAPVEVNQGSLGAIPWDCKVAALPGGEAVVVWRDERSGTSRIYAQKLNAGGAPQWGSTDQLVQPGGPLAEHAPEVATDSLGRSHVAWTESPSSSDIRWNRLDPDGTPLANLGAILAGGTTEQFNPWLAVDSTGISLAYWELDGSTNRIRADRFNHSALPLWGGPTTVYESLDSVNLYGLVRTGSGLLVGFSAGTSSSNEMLVRPVALNGSLPTADAVPVVPEEPLIFHGAMHLANAGAGVDVLLYEYSVLFPILRLASLTDLGEQLWSEPRLLPREPGFPYIGFQCFIRQSGADDGFTLLWNSTMDGGFQGYGRDYASPVLPWGDNWTRLAARGEFLAAPRGTQLPDRGRIVMWIGLDGQDIALLAQRFQADWTPVWPAPVRVCDPAARFGFNTWDLVLDSLGRVAVVWEDRRNGDTQIFYQLLDTDGSRVLPVDQRIDTAPPGSDLDDPTLAADTDGTVLVAWTDDQSSVFRVMFNRIGADGVPLYPLETPVDDQPTLDKESPSLAVLGGQAYIAYIRYALPAEARFRAIDPVSGPSISMGGPHDEVYEVQLRPWESSLIGAYVANDAGNYRCLAQRFIGGTPVWSPEQVNVGSYSSMGFLDAIGTGSSLLTFSFAVQTPEGIRAYLQQLDIAGNPVYPADQPMIDPLPQVRDYGEAVSSQLAGTATWALLTVDQEENGGILHHYFSPDGGASWEYASPGWPVVFPTVGSDLRWGSDLYSPIDQQISPVVHQIDLAWDEGVAVDLRLNDHQYAAGEAFRLSLRIGNPGPPVSAETWLVLDVAGEYWFWPGWTQDADSVVATLPAGVQEQVILEFTWPSGAGAGSGLGFWAALVEPGTANLLGPYDYVGFEFL